jgi:integrase
VKRHLGIVLAVEVAERTVKDYQSLRLKENAAPKTINEEVGFLLRLLGDRGDVIRGRLRRQKALKLSTHKRIAKAFTTEEKDALLKAARTNRRSPSIYPALMLAFHTGMRSAEIRQLQWSRLDLEKGVLVVGESKTEIGRGREIALNSALRDALLEYEKWYRKRFGAVEADWFVFPFGKPFPKDPTRHAVSLRTAWTSAREKANVKGRWHDSRHTVNTELDELGVGDETIRSILGWGHNSSMRRHYSHIRLDAQRRALEGLVRKPVTTTDAAAHASGTATNPASEGKESPKVTAVH